MTLKNSCLCICLIALFSFSLNVASAQKVQILGEAEITELDTANNEDLLLVKKTDGILGVREVDALPFVFERAGFVRQRSNYNDDFVFGRNALPQTGLLVSEDFFFFDESKGAFRGGRLAESDAWEPDKIGLWSFAYGHNVTASGRYAFAVGAPTFSVFFPDIDTRATGWWSKAIGRGVTATGDESTAIGSIAEASGTAATAIGSGLTRANLMTGGFDVFKIRATGDYSVALGALTRASGDYSLAIGSGFATYIPPNFTVPVGLETLASGERSIALGSACEAIGRHAMALGYYTSAPSAFETAVGAYNTPDMSADSNFWVPSDRLFVIGNGTSDAVRSDAFIMLKNGNSTLKGKLTLTNGADSFTLPNSDGAAEQVLKTDGSGNVSWTQDEGAFERSGSLIRQTGNYGTDDFLFGRDALPPNGIAVIDTLILFDKSKGAFRGGILLGSANFSSDSIGTSSFAYGLNAKAKGLFSAAIGAFAEATAGNSIALGNLAKANGSEAVALGSGAQATGGGALALGKNTNALGSSSTAFGNGSSATGSAAVAGGSGCLASGLAAIAIGTFAEAESGYETVLGRYNTDYTPANTAGWDTTDRLFVLGNGTSPAARSDAMVVLKNGDTGFGTSTPVHPLEMGSGAHVTAAGVWTDASDISKKYAIEDLEYGLEEILLLNPKSYNYKIDGTESIGFIAQEMEEIIPEIVSGEEGNKGIGYGQLNAVLVNAVKELSIKNDRIKNEIGELRIKNDSIKNENAEIKKELNELWKMIESIRNSE